VQQSYHKVVLVPEVSLVHKGIAEKKVAAFPWKNTLIILRTLHHAAGGLRMAWAGAHKYFWHTPLILLSYLRRKLRFSVSWDGPFNAINSTPAEDLVRLREVPGSDSRQTDKEWQQFEYIERKTASLADRDIPPQLVKC